MQIYVNEQKLDASLAGEKDLEQVYEEVNRWSAEQKHYIIDILVDKQEVPITKLKEYDVSSVERIDFIIGNELDMVLSTVEELDRYIDQVGSALFEQNEITEKNITDLRDGMHWIREIMGSLSAILKVDLNAFHPAFAVKSGEDSHTVEMVLVNLENHVDQFHSDRGESALHGFLDDLRVFKYFIMKLQLQLRAMNATVDELLEIIFEFEQKIPELAGQSVEINASFHAGRDANALEELDILTEKLNLYISAVYALDYKMLREGLNVIMTLEDNGRAFHELASSFVELLQDLSSALEDSDIVAAGDILEYELSERLNEFVPYLRGIHEFVVARK